MDIYEEVTLQDCPYCGGPGVLEEENGWCWSVVCMDCGCAFPAGRLACLCLETGEIIYSE